MYRELQVWSNYKLFKVSSNLTSPIHLFNSLMELISDVTGNSNKNLIIYLDILKVFLMF